MKKESAKTNKTETEADVEVQEVRDDVQVNEGKVGSMMHEARLKKGKKISEIAKDLCIRGAFLEAIESSNYEEIPEPPYGIGFIRSYADYLGLNASRLVQLYKEETDANSGKNNDYYVMEPQSEATAPNKKYLMISLLAIIAVYFIWFLYNEKLNSEAEEVSETSEYSEVSSAQTDYPLQVEDFASVEESTSAEVAPGDLAPSVPVIDLTTAPVEAVDTVVINESSFVETPKAEAPKVEVKKVAPKEEKKVDTKAGSRVTVKVKGGDNWVEVKDGQKLYISKVLRNGESYVVPAGKGMILSVGRFEGTEVLVDGKITPVVTADKKTNIELDKFLDAANH